MTKEEIIRNYGSLSLAYIGDAAYELSLIHILGWRRIPCRFWKQSLQF